VLHDGDGTDLLLLDPIRDRVVRGRLLPLVDRAPTEEETDRQNEREHQLATLHGKPPGENKN